jgi:hypothetical protein
VNPSNLNAETHPAIIYLEHLFKPDDLLCLTFISGTKTYASGGAVTENKFVPMRAIVTDGGIERLTKRNKTEHIYVSMAPFKEGSANRTKANISEVRHVFMDADADGDAVLAAVRTSVGAGDIPAPTVIVQSSPGKYQFVWNVEGFDIPQQEATNRSLQKNFGTDAQAVDAARVLRIPGFKNIKAKYVDPKPVAQIVELNPDEFLPVTPGSFSISREEPDRTIHEVASSADVQKSIEYLEDAMDAASVGFTRKPWDGSGGAHKFMLAVCPWRESHENGGDGDAIAIVQPSAKFAFKCLHDHCSDKGWDEFRAHLEEQAGRKLKFGERPPPEDPKPGSAKLSKKKTAKSTANGKPKSLGAAAAVELERPTKTPVPRLPQGFNYDRDVSSGTADKISPKTIKWLWKNRIPHKLTLIVGNPDVGKGLISHYLTACITTGTDWYDGENLLPPSEVVILSGEEDWDDTVVPRLMSAGADLSKVHWLKLSAHSLDGTPQERELALDTDARVLDEFLKRHPNVRMVVIDPISNYLGRTKMIDEQMVRSEILTPLKEIANRNNVAVLGVMHLNKKVDLGFIHRIGGAMAFVGVARMVWLCSPQFDDEGNEIPDAMMMVKVKGNNTQRSLKGLAYTTKARKFIFEGQEEWVPYVEWTGEMDTTAANIGATKKAAHRPPTPEGKHSATIWLREYLKDGAKTVEDIEDEGLAMRGFSVYTLRRVRADEKSGILTFASGTRKARDGKSRRSYSCRLDPGFELAGSTLVAVDSTENEYEEQSQF